MAVDPAARQRSRRIAAIVLVVAVAGIVLAAVRGQWVSCAALALLAVSQLVLLRSTR